MSDPNKEDNTKLQSALNLAKSKDGAKNALAMLFPKIEKLARTYVPSHPSINERMRKRRLSVEDFSANYFLLTPDFSSWGQAEFEKIAEGTPAEAFESLRAKLSASSPEEWPDIRRIFLELLDTEFSTRKMLDKDWLAAILNESPSLLKAKDEEAKFLLHIDNSDRLEWLIRHGIDQLPIERRGALLKEVIPIVDDISVLANVVRSLIGDLNPEGDKGQSTHNSLGDQDEPVRDVLVARIRDLAKEGELWKQASPKNLLWFWWGATDGPEVKSFTSKAIRSQSGLHGLMDASIGKVRSSAGDYERVSPHFSKIVDLDLLASEAEEAARTRGEPNKEKLVSFLEALQRGRGSSF